MEKHEIEVVIMADKDMIKKIMMNLMKVIKKSDTARRRLPQTSSHDYGLDYDLISSGEIERGEQRQTTKAGNYSKFKITPIYSDCELWKPWKSSPAH